MRKTTSTVDTNVIFDIKVHKKCIGIIFRRSTAEDDADDDAVDRRKLGF